MRVLIVLGALIAGCDVHGPQGSGIAVGNPPGTVAMRVTLGDSDGIAFTGLRLPVGSVYLETCDGRGRTVDLREPVVFGLDGPSIQVDDGEYCAFGLIPADDPTQLDGEARGGTWTFREPLGRIYVYGRLVADRDALVLELGEPGWLDPDAFGLGPDQHLDIGGDRCGSDSLCARIRDGLTLQGGAYTDPDGNGRVDTPERDRGADAVGDGRD